MLWVTRKEESRIEVGVEVEWGVGIRVEPEISGGEAIIEEGTSVYMVKEK